MLGGYLIVTRLDVRLNVCRNVQMPLKQPRCISVWRESTVWVCVVGFFLEVGVISLMGVWVGGWFLVFSWWLIGVGGWRLVDWGVRVLIGVEGGC